MTKFLRTIFPKSQPKQVKIVYRDSLRISVTDWRSDMQLCATARKTLNDPAVKQLIDVCRFGSMLQLALAPNTPIDERAAHQAKCEGYALALNDLESLGEPIKVQELPESTFEDNAFDHEPIGRG